MKASKSDQKLLSALKEIPSLSHRETVISHLSGTVRQRLNTHLHELVLQKRPAYKLGSEARAALTTALKPHRRRVKSLLKRTDQRGSGFPAILLATLAPVIADIVMRKVIK